MSNTNTILVTGANGFIGANTVKRLAADGCDVIACDLYPTQSADDARYFVDVPKQFIDRDALKDWLQESAPKLAGVVHLGACSDTTVRDREFVMRVNYDYSRMIFSWCADHGVPLVYASSAATYGDGSQGFDDTTSPDQLSPINLYGESKNHFDQWALEQIHTPPRWAGVKYFNVYGPYENHKARMASMAFHWYHQVSQTGEAKLFESHRPDYQHGEQQRDFIFVKDAVDATLHLLQVADVPNGLYNVGTGRSRTFADLAKAVFAALDLPPKLMFIPMPEDLQKQYQYFTQATTDKLRAAGYDKPFTELETAVAQYVQYLKKA